jgi:HrpA-like RNA helicase
MFTGITKIVISTNIAETSVTVNDIVAVIDCGTHKEMYYDPRAGMSCLLQTRLSRANASQRAGRAGRVRPGISFHMFMRREEEEMAAQQLPEMLRCPLESVCLRIKTLRLGFIRDFLGKAIEPPAMEAVDHVIETLATLR